MQSELQKRQDRLDDLLGKRAQLQQKMADAEDAMQAPFNKLHEAARKRAESFLPGGRQSTGILDKAKVPASMRNSPEFAAAFKQRLTQRLDHRFEQAPMSFLTHQKLRTIAALAARTAVKDVQAERDLARLNEI